jgi:hypothetical protein
VSANRYGTDAGPTTPSPASQLQLHQPFGVLAQVVVRRSNFFGQPVSWSQEPVNFRRFLADVRRVTPLGNRVNLLEEPIDFRVMGCQILSQASGDSSQLVGCEMDIATSLINRLLFQFRSTLHSPKQVPQKGDR